ncbi:MAG: hypothetical protein PHC40_03270 [Eubacteriales bacterium]|nr:hypothetical protein [Eubacteriales bacterium]
MTQKTCPVPQNLKFVFTIVKRDVGEAVAAFYRSHAISYNFISPGYGAAGLEIRDYLGFSETEKDIVISVCTEEELAKVLPAVVEEFDLEKPDSGILFSIPVAGISGPRALLYVTGYEEEVQENSNDGEKKESGDE